MATVKEKPKSQAQIDRERAARKRYKDKQKRQAAKDAEILSRAAAAIKAPAPPKQKRVAAAVDSQQEIAGLRAEVERLQAEIKRLQGVVLSQNESAAKLIEEKNAIAKLHQDNLDALKAMNGTWVLIQVED